MVPEAFWWGMFCGAAVMLTVWQAVDSYRSRADIRRHAQKLDMLGQLDPATRDWLVKERLLW